MSSTTRYHSRSFEDDRKDRHDQSDRDEAVAVDPVPVEDRQHEDEQVEQAEPAHSGQHTEGEFLVVVIFSTSTVILRSKVLPSWLALVGCAAGVITPEIDPVESGESSTG